MDTHPVANEIDWNPILLRLQMKESRPTPAYPGDLKAALLNHAGLFNHPKGEAAYQMAVEIARLTTCCDPEVVYWFSRIVSLMDA
ncbi:hypothetical protein [Trichocoleus sp. FACHB-262]|uniref:hypothetical protein n=1 Tax=Trichocoleus sp. FACHB-262 TaxID=2692869 RepID=UPI001681DCA2|nr:hypothetical protein [Trichocoleus sp. FACHB-262]MBD2120576.1 hypothetical protein [Trichocoleus sp. FACHB-262]